MPSLNPTGAERSATPLTVNGVAVTSADPSVFTQTGGVLTMPAQSLSSELTGYWTVRVIDPAGQGLYVVTLAELAAALSAIGGQPATGTVRATSATITGMPSAVAVGQSISEGATLTLTPSDATAYLTFITEAVGPVTGYIAIPVTSGPLPALPAPDAATYIAGIYDANTGTINLILFSSPVTAS